MALTHHQLIVIFSSSINYPTTRHLVVCDDFNVNAVVNDLHLLPGLYGTSPARTKKSRMHNPSWISLSQLDPLS